MSPALKVLTKKEKAQVETLAAVLSKEEIASYLGIRRELFHAILKRDEDVYEAYERGKAKAVSSVAGGLLRKALRGDTTCMIFYLKTRAAWRETQNHNHSSEDGSMASFPTEIYLSGDVLVEKNESGLQ